jgi:Ca-activated chloride channel homolog
MGALLMIEFFWPAIFLLIPLPLLIYRFFPAGKRTQIAALKVPEWSDFGHLPTPSSASFFKLKTVLISLLWLALLTAAARPQWVGKMIEIPQSGRDLMLAVDLSGSMQIKDFEINGKFTDRLTALKLIASDFIDRRKGDRIGLILFGSQAYLQTPLTFDTSTVKQLLMESAVGLAGNETAIGDAIGLAVKQLRNSPDDSLAGDRKLTNEVNKVQNSRVLILITDGNNNAGKLTPEKAAEIASHAKLKVHTVGIGAKEMAVQTIFGTKKFNPSAEMDEKALKNIAEKTGGQYFRAYNTSELIQIYQAIDQLETIERTNQYYRPTEEIYYWPLSLALACLGMLICSEWIKGWRK